MTVADDLVVERQRASVAGQVVKELSSINYEKNKQLLKDEFNLRFFKLSKEDDAVLTQEAEGSIEEWYTLSIHLCAARAIATQKEKNSAARRKKAQVWRAAAQPRVDPARYHQWIPLDITNGSR